MSTLSNLIGNTIGRTTQDGIRREATTIANRTIRNEQTRVVNQVAQAVVPQVLQPLLLQTVRAAISVTLDGIQRGVQIPGTMTTGGQPSAQSRRDVSSQFSPTAADTLIDVGSPGFVGNVTSTSLGAIVPQVRSLSNRSGITSPAKVNQIVNTTTTSVQNALQQSVNDISNTTGTTKLTPQQFDQFKSVVDSQIFTTFAASGLNTTDFTEAVLSIDQVPLAQFVPNRPSVVNPSQLNNEIEVPQRTSPLVPEHHLKVFLRNSLPGSREQVLFKHQPRISINHSATYSELTPLHMPGGFMTYRNNPVKEYSLSDIKLFSRTPEEATENLRIVHLLKGWLKPKFGRDTPYRGVSSEVDANLSPTVDVIPNAPSTNVINFRIDGVRQFSPSERQIAQVIGGQTFPPRPETVEITDPYQALLVPPFNRPAATTTSVVNTESINPQAVTQRRSNTLARTPPGTTRAARPERTPTIESVQQERTISSTPVGSVSDRSTVLPTSGSVDSYDLGTPPPVLYFYAYSNDSDIVSGTLPDAQNIYRVPTVIKSVGYEYPNEVDYIPTTTGIPFPTVMTIQITLMEVRSPLDMERFSVEDYKLGKLVGWY